MTAKSATQPSAGDHVGRGVRRLTLHSLGNLVEDFILTDACGLVVSRATAQRGRQLTVGIVVAAETDHHETFLLGEDGLVDVPGCP
jgi:hypothetical protein